MVAKAPKVVTKPDAWIVVNNQQDKSKPSDRGRKSIKNGKVYLDDGQEFELELHNPLQECVLCDVKLNGQSISKSGLVLKPGQRFYLDCFIDDKKKFVFNTYEVGANLESISAIEKNGSLEVFFYKESVVSINNWKERFDRIIVEKWYPVYYPQYYPYHHYYDPYYYPNRIYGGGIIGSTTISGGTGVYGVLLNGSNTTTNLNNLNSTTVSRSTTSDYSSFTSNASGSLYSAASPTGDAGLSLNNIETGRVEKGTSSSQKFAEIDMDFESKFISSTIIQLLPTSVKPVETKDIVEGYKSDIIFDENTGTLSNKLNKLELKDILKKGAIDAIELIKKLSDLHKAGILTDDEFNNKKAELLSKI